MGALPALLCALALGACGDAAAATDAGPAGRTAAGDAATDDGVQIQTNTEDAGTQRTIDASMPPADDGDAQADADDGTDANDDGCEAVVADILLTCGNIVCHDPFSGGIGTFLDLSMPGVLPGSLIGLTSTPECGERPYLDPEAPGRSLLRLKIEEAPPCGERMPAGDRPPLTTAQRTCFIAWIDRAAERARTAR